MSTIRSHASPVGDEHGWSPVRGVEDGESGHGFAALRKLLSRQLDASKKTMLDADREYLSQRREEAWPRIARDMPVPDHRRALQRARRACREVFGRESDEDEVSEPAASWRNGLRWDGLPRL